MINSNHTEIIQMFIDKYNYKSYLEIGIEWAINYNAIKCDYKVGIDSNLECARLGENILTMTSDEYFHKNTRKFDLIFIDGLHESEQFAKDLIQSINSLNPIGTIIAHDVNPENFEQQIVPRGDRKVWTGDVWETWVYWKRRNQYLMYVIDCDFGIGILQRRPDSKVNSLPITWENFQANKKEWLNLTDKIFLED